MEEIFFPMYTCISARYVCKIKSFLYIYPEFSPVSSSFLTGIGLQTEEAKHSLQTGIPEEDKNIKAFIFHFNQRNTHRKYCSGSLLSEELRYQK